MRMKKEDKKITALKENLKSLRKEYKNLEEEQYELQCDRCDAIEDTMFRLEEKEKNIKEQISRLRKTNKIRVTRNKMGKTEIWNGDKLTGVQG